ncbi:CHASE2 domain-containing protein [Paraburkholderia sp. BL6665CI2N2]|uniref:CHASE2 domain-containing protein n=1 Tax=Paraburkholderia sp. BL6665CI2N2 TaxID=1938806 RepID=UPI001416EE9D|nr:CHASE2 domain-containing protein [Paraburkholderia sp. BL6665CI2N2]
MNLRASTGAAFDAVRQNFFGKTALQAGLAIVMGIAASATLPHIFGEDFATRKAARLYAPAAGEAYGNGSREALTVALIDDITLQRAGQTWPPSYGYYARVLRAIKLYKPKAIFFDIALREFRENDKSISTLVDTVCTLKAAGIPVYLASQPDAHGRLTTIPPMQALEGKCLSQVGVTYKADELDHEVWEYPLESHVDGSTPVRSAAMAIYEDLYGKPLPRPATRMALTWGLHPAPDGLTWIKSNSAADNESSAPDGKSVDATDAYCRGDFGLMELVPAGIREAKFKDADRPVCVFHHTVYVHDLGGDEDTDTRITAELKDKVVLLGTDRKFGGDYINSPINDRIPGVYLHAMALDNLITYGADYKRATSLAATRDADNLKLLLLTVISLAAVAVIRIIKNRLRRTRSDIEPENASRHAYTSNIDVLETTPGFPARLRPLVMVWPGQECEDDGRWRRATTWIAHKGADALCRAGRSLLNLLLSALLVLGVLVVGQHFLNVGFLTVVDVVGFALAAEWLEWNETFLDWISQKKLEGTPND